MVLRRLVVLTLLALTSVLGLADHAASTPRTAMPAMPATVDQEGLSRVLDQAGVVDDGSKSPPCFLRADCAGGALLAGAAVLLFLPAPALSLPSPGPGAGALASPAGLRSALLAHEHFRPPRPS